MVAILPKITVLCFYMFMAISVSNDVKAGDNTANNHANTENQTDGHDPADQQSHDSSKTLKIFKLNTDLNPDEHTSSFKDNYVDLAVNNPGSSVSSFTYCFRYEVFSLNYQCLFYEGTPDIKFNFPEPHLNYGFVHFRGKANLFLLPNGWELLPRVWYHVCVSHDAKDSGHMSIKAYFDGYKVIDNLMEIDTQHTAFEPAWRIGFCEHYMTHNFLHPLTTILRGALSDFNVWGKALTDSEMIMFTKTCTSPGYGAVPAADVINWETVATTKGNNAIEDTLSWVCSEHQTSTLVFDPNIQSGNAMDWCQQLGGSIPLPKTSHEAEDLSILLSSDINGTMAEGCEHFWMPILQRQKITTNAAQGTAHKRKRSTNVEHVVESTDSSHDSSPQSFIWAEYHKNKAGYNHESILFMPWDEEQPDGLQFQPCVSLDLEHKTFHDKPCHHDDFCGVCQFEGPVHYYLRGSPELHELDREYVYVPHGTMVGTSSIIISGYLDNYIRLNADLKTWEIVSKFHHGSIAKLKEVGAVSPFGRKTWLYVENVQGTSQRRKRSTNVTEHVAKSSLMEKELKLTRCNPKSHFTCKDGSCVEMEKRCDNVPNCDDHSDEYDCKIMLLDKHTYRQQYPPIVDTEHHVDVDVSAVILKMGNFEDINMSYRVKFIFTLKWYDHHLTYANLKDDLLENVVDDENKHSIWIPPLTFNNTKGNVMVSVDEPSGGIFVERGGKPTVAPTSVIDETFYYSGDNNKVVFIADYELEFHCNFDLICYPFDIQICGMEVKLSESVVEHASVRAEMVKYLGDKQLSQYEVIKVEIVSHSSDYLMIEFTLKRMYSYYLATTYLPSICLLLAAEITLFIDESHFEATTMVALTSMLVMYTLFQSTAQSLPQTSYLKMIDMWLLPLLIIPFVCFCLEVFVELINWKLEQMNKVPKNEQKLSEGDIEDEEKQKVFQIMFKLGQTSTEEEFDQQNSASSAPDTILGKGKDQKSALHKKRNRVALTKYVMQDLLGKRIIPGLTALLLIIYIIAVLTMCA